MWRIVLLLGLISSAFTFLGAEGDVSRKSSSVYTSIQKGQALESGGTVNLNWRGQGLAPWCFAFAEEQVIKDELCEGEACQYNANEWSVSIFDIAIAHEKADFESPFHSGEKMSRIRGVFRGSIHSFPYLKEGASLRASKCTLEKELLSINRMMLRSTYAMDFYDMLVSMHESLRDPSDDDQRDNNLAEFEAMLVDPNTSDEIREFLQKTLGGTREFNAYLETPEIKAVRATLKPIALATPDPEEFISKVLRYSRCDDRIELPAVEVEEKVLVDTDKIIGLLEELLQERSVEIGICANVWESESEGEGCSGHAVTLRDQTEDQFLVVDSAFIPDVEKNQDGSFWLDKNLVAKAVSEMGKVQNQASENSKNFYEEMLENMESSIQSTNGPLREILVESFRPGVDYIKGIAILVPEENLKKFVIDQAIKMYPAVEGQEDDELTPRELENAERLKDLSVAYIMADVSNLEFKTVDDIDQILPILVEAVVRASNVLQQKVVEEIVEEQRAQSKTGFNLGSNIIWFK